jgi:hypothetical protein
MSDFVIAKYLRLSLDDAVSGSMSIPHQRLMLDEYIDWLFEGVDRLKCLGNAVVPQQIYPILKAIAEIERADQMLPCRICSETARQKSAMDE